MPQATRLGDRSSGHGLFMPTSLTSASENVYINGLGAGRQTDSYASHQTPYDPPHIDTISQGSKTVYINSLQSARVGDPLSPAGTVATGSENVYIGG